MSNPMDPMNLIISGTGGQGNILLSRMIGRILIAKGYKVSIGESFGAAQRGGSVYSSMRVSKHNDYGPLIPEGKAHLIMSLEPLEALRMLLLFGNPDIATIANIQPVYPVGVLSRRLRYPDMDEINNAIRELSKSVFFVDATKIAMDMKASIVANIVMLGTLVASMTLPITREDVEREIRSSFPTSVVDLNLTALRQGMKAA